MLFLIDEIQLISIHALLAESDDAINGCNSDIEGFLSTLSLRRATKSLLTSVVNSTDFYPRSPCGERRVNEDRYGQQY